MALTNHEIYMLWEVQINREGMTPRGAITEVARLTGLDGQAVTLRLVSIAARLLDKLPADEVRPMAAEWVAQHAQIGPS